MQKVNVPLNGITHSTSGNVCLDGDMSELTNWRHKDGSLQPTFDTKEVFSMAGAPYKKVFVHRNGTYENWIGLSATAVFWFATTNNRLFTKRIAQTVTTSETIKIAPVTNFTNIEQMGNILIVTNDTGITYIFFKDGAYMVLPFDNIFPELKFTPSLKAANAEPEYIEADMMSAYCSDWKATFGSDFYLQKIKSSSSTAPSVPTFDFNSADEAVRLIMDDYIRAAVNTTHAMADEYGWLHGVRYVRYAVKLFDGNYIMHSAPILIVPPRGISEEEFIIRASGIELYFLSFYNLKIAFPPIFGLSNLKGIISGVDIFVSQQIVRGDYDFKHMHSLSTGLDANDAKIPKRTIEGVTYGHVSTALYEFFDKKDFVKNMADASLFYKIKSLSLDELAKGDLGSVIDTKGTRDNLATNEMLPDDSFSHNAMIPKSTFMYNGKLHIGSIKTKLFKGHALSGVGVKASNSFRTYGNISLCTTTELGDNGSIVARVGSTGNSLITGYMAIPPNGVAHLKGYERYCMYSGSYVFMSISGVRNSSNETVLTAVPYFRYIKVSRYVGESVSLDYNDGDFCFITDSYWRTNYEFAMTETRIRTSDGVRNVYSDPIAWEYVGNYITPYLSYPDARAESITVWLMDTTDTFCKHKTFLLKPHALLNLAYYIDPNYKYIEVNKTTYTATGIVSDVNGKTALQVAALPVAYEVTPAKLKVSKVYNPLYFDAVNTYEANGEIVGMASINESVSEGTAFGMNPLYVFTKQGIQLLEVGTTTFYTRLVDGPRDVCVNKDGILPLNSGVVFPTEKGLMVISGTTTRNLSDSLRGVWRDNLIVESQFQVAVNNSRIAMLVDSLTDYSFDDFFESFLEKCAIGYNHHEDEVVLSGFTPIGKRVCFVLNVITGNWHKSTIGIGSFVSFYPKLYRIMESTESLSIHDMNTNGLPLDTLLVSRPIKFGSTAFKKLTKAYLRGEITTGNIANDGTVTVYGYTDIVQNERIFRLMVFGSQDCESWKFIGGVDRMGSQHDISTDLFPVTCKYFRVVFAGKPFYGTRLDGLEFLTDERYGDKPR